MRENIKAAKVRMVESVTNHRSATKKQKAITKIELSCGFSGAHRDDQSRRWMEVACIE